MIGYLRRQWPWWLFNGLLLIFSGAMVGWSVAAGHAFSAAANAVCGGFALSNLMSEYMFRKFRQRAIRDYPLDMEKAAEEATYQGIKNALARLGSERLIKADDLEVINQMMQGLPTRH